MTPLEAKRIEFWNAFNERILGMEPQPFKTIRPIKEQGVAIPTGKAPYSIFFEIIQRDSLVRVGFGIQTPGAIKTRFNDLLAHRNEIEGQFGKTLTWRENPGKNSSAVIIEFQGLDLFDSSNHKELMDKAIVAAMRLRKSFGQFI